jgi:hypothetical protein
MKARLVKFGEIEVEGKRYTHDVVIDGGKVRKRKKGPSKQFREKFGHTPLSAGEEIPWAGKRSSTLPRSIQVGSPICIFVSRLAERFELIDSSDGKAFLQELRAFWFATA